MRAREFVAQLANVDLERLSQIFHYLGDHLHEMQTTSGMRLRDETDFRAFLYELAAAAQFRPAYPVSLHKACPRCGHVHQGDSECGEDMGGGRICRCELEVPA